MDNKSIWRGAFPTTRELGFVPAPFDFEISLSYIKNMNKESRQYLMTFPVEATIDFRYDDIKDKVVVDCYDNFIEYMEEFDYGFPTMKDNIVVAIQELLDEHVNVYEGKGLIEPREYTIVGEENDWDIFNDYVRLYFNKYEYNGEGFELKEEYTFGVGFTMETIEDTKADEVLWGIL